VEELVSRIHAANSDHRPQRRRLSLRDNDLVTTMNHVIMNDPSVTTISIENDASRFQQIPKSLILEFAESLRANLHVQSLTITGCELDNVFLSALSTSIESNVVIESINLSCNSFTSDALVEFCQAMAVNSTVRKVDLREQISPILTTADDEVIPSLHKNRRVEKFRVDVKSSELKSAIKCIVSRNKDKPFEVDSDSILLEFLEKEATRAEELQRHRQLEARVLTDDDENDENWKYLYELSELANKYKLSEMTDDDNDKNAGAAAAGGGGGGGFGGRKENLQKMLGTGAATSLTSDGAFLTNDYISSFLVEDSECGSLTFAFQSQVKLFKRFPSTYNDSITLYQ